MTMVLEALLGRLLPSSFLQLLPPWSLVSLSIWLFDTLMALAIAAPLVAVAFLQWPSSFYHYSSIQRKPRTSSLRFLCTPNQI